LRAIANDSLLPAPLSIKEFTEYTDINDEKELLDKIKEKSIDTAVSFAFEISKMKGYRILLLCFSFYFRKVFS
jgi:hypothetical protein